jgi:hypothetical protein
LAVVVCGGLRRRTRWLDPVVLLLFSSASPLLHFFVCLPRFFPFPLCFLIFFFVRPSCSSSSFFLSFFSVFFFALSLSYSVFLLLFLSVSLPLLPLFFFVVVSLFSPVFIGGKGDLHPCPVNGAGV